MSCGPNDERRGRPTVPPGAVLLRTLREASGRTQLWVEAEADLGTGYLQRVESGKVAQPSRATLQRILTALGARYSEQCAVLEHYGYTVATPPPDEADCAWARTTVAAELAALPFPAYLLDCTHRLLAWNAQVPRLFGISKDDPTLGGLAGRSLLAAWFDSASWLAERVVAPDRFCPGLIRAFQFEMRRFESEAWCQAVRDELLSLPRFRYYWEVVNREMPAAIPQRALVPVELRVPGAGVLAFRLIAEPLVRDDRFRTIGYVPADTRTIRWCAAASDD